MKLKFALDYRSIHDQSRQELRVDVSERLAAVKDKVSTEMSFSENLGCVHGQVLRTEVAGIYPTRASSAKSSQSMRHMALLLCGLLAACATTPPCPPEKRVPTPTRSETFFIRAVATTSDSTGPAAPSAEGMRVFNERDVVQQFVLRRKPGDVANWWNAEPRAHPNRWLHPLSFWESGYLEAMLSSTVPAPLRMRPPVNPEHLTPREAQEAEQLVGPDAATAREYAHFENRRRIVAHYVLTHPATIRIQLGLYELVRDTNPLHFALERGWQVGRGEEMFTEQDVSRLGAAAEFLAALAVGVAVEKALGLAHPFAERGGSARNLTPEVEGAFVQAVRLRAAHMLEALSNKERGPVLTGVLDMRTGRTFFGINQKEPPLDLHPLLKDRLAGYLSETRGLTPERAGTPGTHSEIVALNRAIHEREAMLGRPVEPRDLSEFVLHNRSLRGSTKAEGIPPPCPNCEAILPPGIRILP